MWGGFTFVDVGTMIELRKTLRTCTIDCIRILDDWVFLLRTLSNGICESDLTPTAIEINTWSKYFSNGQACLSSQKKKRNMGPGTNALYMLQTILLDGFLMSHQKLNALLRWPEKQKSQSATVTFIKLVVRIGPSTKWMVHLSLSQTDFIDNSWGFL